jgi:hypothetical protein
VVFGKQKDGGRVRQTLVWSTNMVLRVAAPAAEGWQRLEAAPRGDQLFAAIKCVLGSPPMALALDALVHALGPDTQLEALRARDWRAHHLAGLFAQLDTVATRGVSHTARIGLADDPGIEVTVSGRLRAPDQPAALRERLVPVPSAGKLLVVSALGAPPLLAEHAALVDSWLAQAALGA